MVDNAQRDQNLASREVSSSEDPAPLSKDQVVSQFAHLESTQQLLPPRASEDPTLLVDPRRKVPVILRVSRILLILTLIAIIGFIGGAAVATSILSGTISLETGWVKELVHFGKEAIKYIRP